mgnify:CR=1 FL=1
MAFRDALRQVFVFLGVESVEACADDGNGAAPCIQGAQMGFRIHAARQAGNDGYSGFRQVMGDGFGA